MCVVITFNSCLHDVTSIKLYVGHLTTSFVMLLTRYVTWTTVHRCMSLVGPKHVHLRQVVSECKYNIIYLQKLSPYILLWAEDCFSTRCTWTSLYLGYKTHTGNHGTLLFSPVNDGAISLNTIIMIWSTGTNEREFMNINEGLDCA